MILEFKNNLEGLIDNLENPASNRWYTLDAITEANLHERHYPGVTHVLRSDSETHIIQVVMLEEIVKQFSTGQIALGGGSKHAR